MLGTMFRAVLLAAVMVSAARAQSAQANPAATPSAAATQDAPRQSQSHPPAAPQSGAQQSPSQQPGAQPSASDAELLKAVQGAGTDSAALVRNLEAFLQAHPDSPAKVSIYRALVESEVHLRNDKAALDYAERLIALQPDNVEMMFFAIHQLREQGGEQGLKRATDYATHILALVENPASSKKPAQMSPEQWEASRKKVQIIVYMTRGELQMDRNDDNAAVADLQKSYSVDPNPEAALRLGEIAELRRQPDEAIARYATAFVLPDQQGSSVDRSELRHKLANLWKTQHGTEAGLGERLLQAYDQVNAQEKPAAPPAETTANQGAAEPFAFVLQRPDGSAPYKLADARGKIVVMNFWATWCTPCRVLEPLLEEVRLQYAHRPDVVFLAIDDDDDRARVKPFLERQPIGSTVVFADGLDRLLAVNELPTIVILGRNGKIAYRATGFDPAKIVVELKAAIERAIAGST